MPPPKPQAVHLHPINWVQRIALYVTHGRYYLVGSNNTQTAFKLLKIDRTQLEQLSIVDDRIEYSYREIRDLLLRLNHGNRTQNNPSGLTKTCSSFGLIGFVRFLHGYYLILIIKRRKVASLGFHTIYKVEETRLVYIPNEQPSQYVNEENKYLRAFTSIDFSSNFYFSYSYDITHSLQYNLCPVRASHLQETITDANNTTSDQHKPYSANTSNNKQYQTPPPTNTQQNKLRLVKSKPCQRFVWNAHLIDFECLHDDWKVYLTHGFVGQSNVSVYSRPIYVTLIARRSIKFCGTRFLKRGLNLDGDVANEVETEQIVHDASVSCFNKGQYTSFVQLRGSLPERWTQDTTKMTPKPPIVQDFVDPFHEATGKHFNDLFKRYGTPVVVLNLIKQQEKKPHESVLNDMLDNSVTYLNQFLPAQHRVRLMALDMAQCNKSRDDSVMQRLGTIGFNIVRVTGIFQSWKSAANRKSNYDSTYTMQLRQRTFNRQPSSLQMIGYRLRNGQSLQNGVVRVNCVDCLDRTNTAQFVLGKVVLGYQLQALGLLLEPKLDYDTEICQSLEQLYEDHGDIIALQYGGSQLVHRIRTYRKTAPLTSQSSEIMQTLSRYYRNTFSDAEKQNAINIFLGIRKASRMNVQTILNYFITDYYLHNQILMKPFHLTNRPRKYNRWYDETTIKSLPRAFNEFSKESNCYLVELREGSLVLTERIDYLTEAYRPYQLTYFSSYGLKIY